MGRFGIEFILITLVSTLKLTCGYINSTSASVCLAYETGSTSKWCRDYYFTDYGYACSTTETTGYCGGSTSVRGSNDYSYLPQNSNKLLCPPDQTNGNTQTASLNSVGENITFNSNTIGASNQGWYKFTPNSNKIYIINIKMMFLTQATAEVYTETSLNSFIYNGRVVPNGPLDILVSNYKPVWVLITSSTSGGYATVYAEAMAELSGYSNTSETIVGTVLGVLLCLGITCGVICGGIYCHSKDTATTNKIRDVVFSTES